MLEARERAGEVYILSNLSEFNQLAIERKFPRFFTYATRNFYSYELGCLKPHPEIFTKARAHMTHRDRSTILLDDMPVNIEGARAAGWGGICFSPADVGKIREQIVFMIEQEKKLQQPQL
jgi:2-haloacid dehalogenase